MPAGFDWDLWLGPREPRPYHPAYTPFSWRGWWAFGGSGLGDIGTHHMDPAFDALQLDTPETVEAYGLDASTRRSPRRRSWRRGASVSAASSRR